MRERRAGITAGGLRNEFHEERNRRDECRNETSEHGEEGGFVVNSSMEKNETDMLLEYGGCCVLAGVQQRRGCVLARWLLLPQKGSPITLCSDDGSEIKGGGKPIDECDASWRWRRRSFRDLPPAREHHETERCVKRTGGDGEVGVETT